MFYQCQASILLFLSALHKCHIFSREPEAKTGTDFSLISIHFLLNRDKSVLFILSLFTQTQFILDFSFSFLQIYSHVIIGCFYLFLYLFFNQAVFYRVGYLFPKLWTFINKGGLEFYEFYKMVFFSFFSREWVNRPSPVLFKAQFFNVRSLLPVFNLESPQNSV